MKLLYLNPIHLEPDPEGTREDPGDIDGLAETIAQQGLLQPLGVVQMGNERYRVIYGSRRRAAAIKLKLEKVPCILLDAEEQNLFLGQLIENVQRQELNDIEKARAFARLRASIAEMHGKHSESELDEATGKAVGLTGRTIRRYLGLLELPPEIQFLIKRGELNVTQAQHLRRIPNKLTQIDLARAAVEEGMSAADLSRLATYFVANPNLTLETALQVLEQGGTLAERPAPEPPRPSTPSPPLERIAPDDVAPWEDDEEDDEDADEEGYADEDDRYLRVDDDETLENQPANKSRVFRIRSLDQMVEETERLSRAYMEGDLVKWARKDESAPYKMRLLLKQLETLLSGLRGIARQQGWEHD